jgi:hypothetical protein
MTGHSLLIGNPNILNCRGAVGGIRKRTANDPRGIGK